MKVLDYMGFLVTCPNCQSMQQVKNTVIADKTTITMLPLFQPFTCFLCKSEVHAKIDLRVVQYYDDKMHTFPNKKEAS